MRLLIVLIPFILASALEATTYTFQHYRWTPTKLRNDGTANSIQVGDFEFRLNGVAVPWTGATVAVPGGNSPGGEPPSALLDNNAGTKWLNFNKFNPVIFSFPAPTQVTGYTFTTANDAPERDPVSWTLEGSNDQIAWAILHTVTDFPTSQTRLVKQPGIVIGAPLPPTVLEFRPESSVVLNGNNVNLFWQTENTDSLTISPGIGEVTPRNGGSIAVSQADRSDVAYSISAANSTDTVTNTVTVRTVTGGSASGRYVRFRQIALRDPAVTMIQLAEFRFFNNGAAVVPVAVSNPGGNSPAAEQPSNLIDGNNTTKWLDFNRAPVVFDFGGTASFNSYQFVTANDTPGRDPVRWLLEVSDDLDQWTLVDNLGDFDVHVPQARFTESSVFPLPGNSVVPVVSLSASRLLIMTGSSADLSWSVAGASGVVANQGLGTLPASGSVTVSPTSDTIYTFTASNSEGREVSSSITIMVAPALPVGQFTFASFADPTAQASMFLLNEARILQPTFPAASGTRLRITPDLPSRVGTAWMNLKQPVANGFNSQFVFQFPAAAGPGADGMAFIVQNTSAGLAAAPVVNQERGLPNDALNVSLVSYPGAELVVSTGSLVLATVDLRTVPGLTLYSTGMGNKLSDIGGTRAPFTVAIDYVPGSLSVSINNIAIISGLTVDLGLAGAADEDGFGYVGFSARTGGANQAHDLLSWSFVGAPGPANGGYLWTGAQSAAWNTLATNWEAGGAKAWDNGLVLEAIFGATGPRAVTVDGSITASRLQFDAPNYVINGGTISLSPQRVVVAHQDATIGSVLAGSNGLMKSGPATMTLTGANTYTGATFIEDGTLSFSGSGSLSGTGELIMGWGNFTRSALLVNTDGLVNFGSAAGNVRIGAGDNAAAAVIQTSGTVVAGSPGPGFGYLTLGGGLSSTSGSYGFYHLAGGTLNAGGGGPSGFRVGDYGHGVYLQTGGTMFSGRWFPIGGYGGQGGAGLATITGGTLTVDPAYRFHMADRASSVATLNIGTQAGGNGVVTTLDPGGVRVGQDANGSSAVVNLNAGRLVLGGALQKTTPGSPVKGMLNLGGGTLVAGANDITLVNGSLDGIYLYNGGVTVDTAEHTATISGSILKPVGKGVYPAGGAIPVTAGGSGYLGAPMVEVLHGFGLGDGLAAIADVQGGKVVRLMITNAGADYAAGDEVTFRFVGGGAMDPAPDFDYTLTAADLADNGAGQFVKTGSGTLRLLGASTYTAPTVIEAGTLVANGILDNTPIQVKPGATLAGNLNSLGPVLVEGILSPGDGTGTATSEGTLTLAAGATLQIDISDWNGDAGSGHDSMAFGSIAVGASPSAKLRVRVAAAGATSFSEANRQFVIATAASGVSGLTADNWLVEPVGFEGAGSWSLAIQGGSLVLSYAAASGTDYTAWADGFPGLSNPAPFADPDGDGIANVLEYVLGGDPTVASTAVLPTVAEDEGDLVFTFVRRTASKSTTVQTFQYGTALAGWTNVPVPATSAGNVTVIANSPAAGVETVVITIDADEAINGRLFGRLQVAPATP